MITSRTLVYILLIVAIMVSILTTTSAAQPTFAYQTSSDVNFGSTLIISDLDPNVISTHLEVKIFHPRYHPFFAASPRIYNPFAYEALEYKSPSPVIRTTITSPLITTLLEQYDASTKLAYSLFSHENIAVSAGLSVFYHIPVFPIQFTLTQTLSSGGPIVSTFYNIGPAPNISSNGPGFANHFPITMYVPDSTTIAVRIGALGIYTDTASDLWKIVGFEFQFTFNTVAVDPISCVVSGAWDGQGVGPTSLSLISVEYTSDILRLTAVLPKSAAGKAIETIEVRLSFSQAVSFAGGEAPSARPVFINPVDGIVFPTPATFAFMTIALDPTLDTSADSEFQHISFQKAGSTQYFNSVAHTEFTDVFEVKRRGTASSTTAYLGAQPMYAREMFWLKCTADVSLGSTGTLVSGSRWLRLTISWGAKTSARLTCTRFISYTAPLLASAIDLYGSSGAVTFTFDYSYGQGLRPYVPKVHYTTFPLADSLEAPSLNLVAYRYGPDLGSWAVKITEPGLVFPGPGDPYIVTNANVLLQTSDGGPGAKGINALGSSWSSTSITDPSSLSFVITNFAGSGSPTSSWDSFTYTSPPTILANTVHILEVGTKFAQIPTKVNDPFSFATYDQQVSTATSLPQFQVKLTRSSVLDYFTSSFTIGVLHLPDFSLSWPAGVKPLELDPTLTKISFTTSLKSRPLYYPTDPAVVAALPPSSAWVLAPNFILYPGSSIRIEWKVTALKGPKRSITTTAMTFVAPLSQLTVSTTTTTDGAYTYIKNPATSPPLVLPNNAADILTNVVITFWQAIPQNAEILATIVIWSEYETTPLPSPPVFNSARPPLSAALKVTFSVTSPVSATWPLAGSSPTTWGGLGTAIVNPTTASIQAISPLALVSFSTASGSESGASVEVSVWYYPELANGTGYETNPVFLKSLGVLADQSATTSSSLVQLSDQIRGYSRAIFRAKYTYTEGSTNPSDVTLEFPYFFTILPTCMESSTTDWITPPNSSIYESSCPQSTPICPQSGICEPTPDPVPAAIKTSFSLPSVTTPGSPFVWDFTPNGFEPVWVPIGTSTVQPDEDMQTITSLTSISFETYSTTNAEAGLKVEISLWHYPLLDATAGTYEAQPISLGLLGTIDDQADPLASPTDPQTPPNASPMRVNRAFFRAVYTVTTPGTSLGDQFTKDSQFLFTIVQSCLVADETTLVMPPTSDNYITNCPQSTPICSTDGLCSAPSLSPVQVTFSLPSSPLPLTWDISDGQTPVWGALGSATIHPTSPQAVSCSADISLSISDPSTAEAGISVDIDLWYYPQFGTDDQPSYSTEPIHLYHFPTISDQTNTSPTLPVSLTNGQVRGYSRAILRATYTITRDGNFNNRSFLREYEHFFSILPACQVADSVNWLAPPTIAQYENVCPVASPICPITGICKATTTPPPVAAPDICKTCHPDNSSGCDAAMTSQPCQCKSGWTGPTCSQSSECERDSTRQCISNKNGFVELINDTCDAKCTCYNEWSGSRCQICSLNCGSAGVAYNDCRRCGCQEGYTGDRCQCQQINGSITLVNGKKNQLLEASNGSFLPRDANPQPFIISQLTLGTALPPSLTNEANLDLWELGHEVYDGLVEPFLGNPNGVFSLQLISIPSPQNPLLTQTTFSIQVTFGCADYNNDVKNIDALTTKWTKFVEGFIRYPVIEKYFGLDLDLVPGESPKPTPPTLPPDGEEYQGNGSTKAEIMIVFTLLSIVALLC